MSAQLDCQGHDVSSISVTAAQGFSIRHCVMHGTTAAPTGSLQNLSVIGGSRVTVDSSDVLGQVFVKGCQGCTFSNDSFTYPSVGYATSGSDVSCELCLDSGLGNTVTQSIIDGGWMGAAQQPVDDGIGLSNEANVVLQGNTIRNVFDAGIEATASLGPVTAAVQGNTITNTGFTGIGAYYTPGWQNSVFSANSVSQAPTFWYFVNAQGAGVSAMTLVNNQFTGNTFIGSAGVGHAARIDYVVGGLPFTVQGNLVQGNNFGSGPGPVFSPASGFVDGGGNVCGPGATVLNCGGLETDVVRLTGLLFRKPPVITVLAGAR